ncbi:vhs domain-containing protein [Coniochaeta sp. 2T2.1]|nr:vhs domain-containing protein [Coniochaeta sp. 2T2.1]
MFSQKKPYSAVTVAVDRLTSETYEEEDLSGIPELVEVIKLQGSGPAEAARAIRKKLKYGSVHRQIRALVLLDGLIQNAGPRFQRTFVDEPLLERLRVCGTSNLSDPDVKKKCSELFRSWAAEYKNTPGLERIATLYKELPRRKQVVTQERSKVIKETENPFGDDDEEEESNPPPAASSSRSQPSSASHSRHTSLSGTQISGTVNSFSYLGKDKDKDKKKKDKKGSSKSKKPFNLEAEKEQMKVTIAESAMAATDLMNALQSINREKERISENETAVKRFETCKQLRRKVLRYIYHVESEQWLGGLLHANDELVQALMTFEQLDRSIDADSDSDDDLAEQAHLYRLATERAKGKDPASPTSASPPSLANLSLNTTSAPPPKPRRPAAPPRPSARKPPVPPAPTRPAAPPSDEDDDNEADEDENDPFADRNAVVTPHVERGEPRW